VRPPLKAGVQWIHTHTLSQGASLCSTSSAQQGRHSLQGPAQHPPTQLQAHFIGSLVTVSRVAASHPRHITTLLLNPQRKDFQPVDHAQGSTANGSLQALQPDPASCSGCTALRAQLHQPQYSTSATDQADQSQTHNHVLVASTTNCKPEPLALYSHTNKQGMAEVPLQANFNPCPALQDSYGLIYPLMLLPRHHGHQLQSCAAARLKHRQLM